MLGSIDYILIIGGGAGLAVPNNSDRNFRRPSFEFF